MKTGIRNMRRVKEVRNDLVSIENRVAEFIEPYLNRIKQIGTNRDSYKIDESIDIDKISTEHAIGLLRKKYPTSSIISEEVGKDLKSDYGFILDIPDGSGNLTGKRPGLENKWGISIAYFEGDSILAGVVLFPKADNALVKDTKDDPIKVCDAERLGKIDYNVRRGLHPLDGIIVTGGNYEEVLTDGAKAKYEDRINFFNDISEKLNWENQSYFCATYDALLLTKDSQRSIDDPAPDGARLHWSPTILYSWDIAATSRILESEDLPMINLETMKKVNLINDFDIYGNNDKYQQPIGAISGHPKITEIVLNEFENFKRK